MLAKIEIEQTLSRDVWRGSTMGQRHWWCLRTKTVRFIPLDNRRSPWWRTCAAWLGVARPESGLYSALAPLRVTLDLTPGIYCFGCGPRPPSGIRRLIEVTPDGVSDVTPNDLPGGS